MRVRALYSFYEPKPGAGRYATIGEALAAMPLRERGEEFEVTRHHGEQLVYMRAVEEVRV